MAADVEGEVAPTEQGHGPFRNLVRTSEPAGEGEYVPRPAATTVCRAAPALIGLVVLALIAGVIVLAVRYLTTDDAACADPPTPPERAEQEAFVTTHLHDARNFDWVVADCDEHGEASVDFTTRHTGRAASQAFLDDPACKASVEPDASPGDVTCAAENVTVSIYLHDTGAIDTNGTLFLDC